MKDYDSTSRVIKAITVMSILISIFGTALCIHAYKVYDNIDKVKLELKDVKQELEIIKEFQALSVGIVPSKTSCTLN